MADKKVAVLRFLGTNCDRDLFKAVDETNGLKAEWAWYEDRFKAQDFDAAVIPGGFSYGDYLRCGALAAKSPAMDSVTEMADQGKAILGICNGFQILCERQLLPGALLKNRSLKFIDEWVELEPVSQKSSWAFSENLRLPIAHADGCYYNTEDGLKKLEDQDQIWLRYQNNPNGSLKDIAGVLQNKVAGLMPHPERAVKSWMGGEDGAQLIERLLV